MENRRIRILEVLTTAQVGGTEVMVLQLAKGLDSGRFSCDMSVLDGHGPIVHRALTMGIPVHDLQGRGGYLGAAYRLRALMKARQYDLVHFYGFRMSVLGRLVAWSLRRRPIVVVGIRGLHIIELGERLGFRAGAALTIERLVNPLVDAFIVISQTSVEFLSRQGLPRGRCIVIPNGIDASGWFRSDGHTVEGELAIICVANFKPEKRQHDLIEAIALLVACGLRVRCVFAGDGVTRSAAENLVRERRLEDVVEFSGRRGPMEIRALLHRAHVFVLPSLWEGMPVSVMEAMAAGLPVVGTDVSGICDLVVDGVTGYLVPPKDPGLLAGRIALLLKDAGLRAEMGRAGHERILNEFSLERMVQRHEDVYTDLVLRRVAHQRLMPSATR